MNPSVEMTKTERGFSYGEFLDAKGVECSIQDSSLATDYCIWFGTQDADPKIMGPNGWEPVPFPKDLQPRDAFGEVIPLAGFANDTLFNTRMHLDITDARRLIRFFNAFLRTNTVETKEYEDRYGHKYSIRLTENRIELGIDDANPQICDRGWKPVPYPEGTVFTTHMHLGKDQVVVLLPILRRFVRTGSIHE